MRAYTIAFESNDERKVAKREVIPFFEKIQDILLSTPENIVRCINGKIMRVHAYERNQMNPNCIVIPIGKLKDKNRPYGIDDKTQKLIDIPMKMYDVSLLAYHKQYNVVLLSANQSGPSDGDIENYLNSFLLNDEKYRIKLRPIMRSIELDKIRNAHEARSITISLNINRPFNDFLGEQVNNEDNGNGILKHLKAMMDYSKGTLESNVFSLTLGLGRQRNGTLDIGALIDLLESINLDVDCIKEITVNYRNSPDEKLDIAKLKDSTSCLKVFFPLKDNQLGAGYVLNNMDELLRNERDKYYAQVQSFFKDAIDVGDDYEIVEEWNEEPVI